MTMVAHTILQQLGGRRFITMTGARNLVDCGNSLMFHIPETKRINHVKIILTDDDLYTMRFGRICKLDYQLTEEVNGVYCDQLQAVFTEVTGLYTYL